MRLIQWIALSTFQTTWHRTVYVAFHHTLRKNFNGFPLSGGDYRSGGGREGRYGGGGYGGGRSYGGGGGYGGRDDYGGNYGRSSGNFAVLKKL